MRRDRRAEGLIRSTQKGHSQVLVNRDSEGMYSCLPGRAVTRPICRTTIYTRPALPFGSRLNIGFLITLIVAGFWIAEFEDVDLV